MADSPRSDDAAALARARSLFAQAAWLSAAAAVGHLAWVFYARLPNLPRLADRVQPAALLACGLFAFSFLWLAAARAALRVARGGRPVAPRVWRWAVAAPLAVLLAWSAAFSWYFGPLYFLPGAGRFELADGLLLLPAAALLGLPAALLATARRLNGRVGAWAAAAWVAALAAAAAPWSRFAPAAAPAPPPAKKGEPSPLRAVVLVLLDTWRADALSCAGAPGLATPVFDGLARRGVLFRQAVAQAPWTIPSVASLLTARYPSVHGAGWVDKSLDAFPSAVREGISLDVPTLAQTLSQAGWTCAGFITNAVLDPQFGFGRGFARYVKPADLRPRIRLRHDMDSVLAQRMRLLHAARWSTILFRNPDCDACFDRLATHRAARWIRRHADRRLFVFLHLFAPHEYAAYKALGPDGQLLTADARRRVVAREMRAAAVTDANADKRRGDLAVLRARYRANVMFDDALVETLLDALRRAGLYDHTLLILTADHGEEFEEHGGRGHGHTLYDELLRVPLILHCPAALPAGRVVEEQVRLIDVMPTILDLAGVEPTARLNGRSLRPLIEGFSEERPAFSEFDERVRLQCVRAEGYKLIVRRGGAERLFNLRADPGERRNLLGRGDPAEPDLRALYASWREEMRRQRQGKRRFIPAINVELIQQMCAMGYLQK